MENTQKSSQDILNELFSAFNAEPPNLIIEIENVTKPKKSKKSKKKHKKKKKFKDKEKNDGTKKDKILNKAIEIKQENETVKTEQDKKDDKIGKGKIQIPNLKFSAVYQETIKAVEEKEKQEQERKAKYEEGEITGSDSNEDTQTNSDTLKRKKRQREKTSTKQKGIRSHSNNGSNIKEKVYSDDNRKKRRKHSRSPSLHRKRSHDRSRSRSRLRSLSKSRRDSRERHRPPRNIEKPRSRERLRSHSKSRFSISSRSGLELDKEKLLAIARKNALKLIDQGVLPSSKFQTAPGKSVNELTEYCKKLSRKDALGDEYSDLSSGSDEEGSHNFHHPFLLRDRPSSIVMNIRNAINLPVRTLQEKTLEDTKQLRLQFPVSSGNSHRKTEGEWVPVEPKSTSIFTKFDKKELLAIMPPPNVIPEAILPPLPPATSDFTAVPPPLPSNLPQFPVIQPDAVPPNPNKEDDVLKGLNAIRKMQELSSEPLKSSSTAARIKESGAFTGTTGARILSADELSSGQQAWAKRDQLISAQPVNGGMGMALLQKMGWQPGQGLGKNKEGNLEPLRLEIKFDKKGLVAPEEGLRMGRKALPIAGPPIPTVKTLDGKHPVSLLNELCSRRKWGPPTFELAWESGPDHQKNFLFKVKVNGMEYTPTVASNNKKQAKSEAAAICLSALGIITKPHVQS